MATSLALRGEMAARVMGGSTTSGMALSRLACSSRLSTSGNSNKPVVSGLVMRKRDYSVCARAASASGSVQEEIAAPAGTITVGQFVVQGLREEMEDEIFVEAQGPHGFSFAGIFDGHAGVFSATFLRYDLNLNSRISLLSKSPTANGIL